MEQSGTLDLDAYLARVGYDRPLRIDAASLADLHEAHLASIPFENLDIFLGKPIRIPTGEAGQHSEEILKGAGFTDAQVKDLRTKGVI